MEGKVYPSEHTLNNLIRARKFEIEGDWHNARILRKFEGQEDHVKAIDMILESTRKGDEFRRLTAGLHEQYEERKINLYQLNEALNIAHDKVYNRN